MKVKKDLPKPVSGGAKRRLGLLIGLTGLMVGLGLFWVIRSQVEQRGTVVLEQSQQAVDDVCTERDQIRLCAELPASLTFSADGGPNLRSSATAYTSLTNLSQQRQSFDFQTTCTSPLPLLNDSPAILVCGTALTRETYAPGETKLFTHRLDRLFSRQLDLGRQDNRLGFSWQGMVVKKVFAQQTP